MYGQRRWPGLLPPDPQENTDVDDRPDLLDRGIILMLPSTPKERCRLEAEVWRKFNKTLPGILDGLFGAVNCAMRKLPNTNPPACPPWLTSSRESFAGAVEAHRWGRSKQAPVGFGRLWPAEQVEEM